MPLVLYNVEYTMALEPMQGNWASSRGLPFSSPGDLPNSAFELAAPALQADSSPLSLQEVPNSMGKLEERAQENFALFFSFFLFKIHLP